MSSNVQVNSKITLNTSKIAELTLKQYEALSMAGDALRTDIIQSGTIPFQTGELQNNKTYVDDHLKSSGRIQVVSEGPYARRLYYHPEYNFSRTKNSHAGAKWFEPYTDGRFIAKAFKGVFSRFL